MPLLLNCDLGELAADDNSDALIMPHIDLANIACGLHAGDAHTMHNALLLAGRHRVKIGAHPGYADRAHFGRLSIPHDSAQLQALLHYQIGALQGMAAARGLTVDYVKPHGALYNDIMANDVIRHTLMSALSDSAGPRILMLLATADAERHREEAARFGLDVLFEAFADRCYLDNGQLVPRSEPGAVHDHQRMLDQVRQLRDAGSVTTHSGKRLAITADTLCVHGDNPAAVATIQAIRRLLTAND